MLRFRSQTLKCLGHEANARLKEVSWYLTMKNYLSQQDILSLCISLFLLFEEVMTDPLDDYVYQRMMGNEVREDWENWD